MQSVNGFVVLISKYLNVWLKGGFRSDERNAHVEIRVSPVQAPSSGTVPIVSGEEGPPQGNREPLSQQKPWAAPAGGVAGGLLKSEAGAAAENRKGHPGELRVLRLPFSRRNLQGKKESPLSGVSFVSEGENEFSGGVQLSLTWYVDMWPDVSEARLVIRGSLTWR